MNINKIQSYQASKINSQNMRKNATNSILLDKQAYDTVSFTGGIKTKFMNKLAACATAAFLAITSMIGLMPTAKAVAPRKNIEDYSSLSPVEYTELAIENGFQLAQTNDAASITIDMTGNFAPNTIKPYTSMVTLSANPDQPGEFSNMGDIITQIYGIDENRTEERYLAGYAIVKANPWMMERITNGAIDYTQGDWTNADPELVLHTDYTVAGKDINILLPEFTPMVETGKKHDTEFVANHEFIPIGADENNVTTITFDSRELAAAETDEEIIAIVNDRLAEVYGIDTMESYAGDAIWHGVTLYEPNEEVFKYSSEPKAKNSLVSYVGKYGSLELVCPRVPVSVMAREDQIQGNQVYSFLVAPRENDAVIDYVASDRTTADLRNFAYGYTTPMDILDCYTLPNGLSIREAYESDNERYESLALTGYRQIIDNNNELLEYYGDREITVDDLYTPFNTHLEDADDARINLQPLAYAQVQGPRKATVTPAPETPTPAPTEEPTPAPTEEPTPEPTATATPAPTATATPAPTATATPAPTATATPAPTATATPEPTECPTLPPIIITPEPTNSPIPSPVPQTAKPTQKPTPKPTAEPTPKPTAEPTPKPTAEPTPKPTAEPTPKPTAEPTPKPTAEPTPKPTAEPTPKPTATAAPCPTLPTIGGEDDPVISETISPGTGANDDEL